MTFRSTAILCLVAIVGVVAAVLVERRDGGGGDGAERTRLLDAAGLPVDEVNGVRLSRAGRKPMVFVRRGEGWWQREPFEHPMDPASVRRLLSEALGLQVIDVIDPELGATPVSRAALGLEPPAAVVEYAWPDGELVLRLGRRGIGGMAYLEREGDPAIYVVNQTLHERTVDMDDKEWRDRTLFRGAGIESDRIEMVNAGGTTVLVRERKQWTMTRPVGTRVDPNAVDGLLQALGRARSGGFVLDQPGDLARFGLEPAAGTITVETTRLVERGGAVEREPHVQRVRAGSRIGIGTQDRFGHVEGRDVVVRLPEPVLKALFPPARQLVARSATGIDPANVKSITIAAAGTTLELRRDIERWVAPEFDARPVSATRVEELLAALARLQATDIVIGPYPRELDVATVTLYGFDARPLDTVRIAREPGEGGAPGRWALENGDGVLRIFPASLDLPLSPAAFALVEATADGSG